MTAGRIITPFVSGAAGTAAVPGSKSITNRAILCAALAQGRSTLDGALFADDTEAMMGAAVAVGASVTPDRSSGRVTVDGIAARPGAPAAGATNDEPGRVPARASGTTARFVLPVLAALGGGWVLDGDAQLRRRPFAELIAALRTMGVGIGELGVPGCLPIEVSPQPTGAGRRAATGGESSGPRHRLELRADVSSQFTSGLLLAGPLLGGIDVQIHDVADAVSAPYIDMTVAVMTAFGAQVATPSPGRYVVQAGDYVACHYEIEPDASTASYFFAAAALCGGCVRVDGLGQSSIQGDVRFAQVLGEMGARVAVGDRSITVEAPLGAASLRGGRFDLRDCSDTAQTLAAVAAFAEGTTHIGGIGFIRRKETDRIGDTVAELTKRGVEASAEPDGIIIRPNAAAMRAGRVDCHDDHRMAMAMSLVGLRVAGVEIDDPGCVAKTFPGFFDALEALRAAPGERDVSTKPVIAIDGPAASGKSSVARAVAAELGVDYLDTGAMYRAVAWAARQAGVDPHDTDGVAAVALSAGIDIANECGAQLVTVNGSDVTDAIRSPEVDRSVSAVAANPAVRRVLVQRQREWARQIGGGVMEGRDIGSVVFPDAELKVFLTATPIVRAARRLTQHDGEFSASRATSATVSDAVQILAADLDRRDRLDSARADSPLRVAAGAVVVDTSDMAFEEVVAEIVELHRVAVTPSTQTTEAVQ